MKIYKSSSFGNIVEYSKVKRLNNILKKVEEHNGSDPIYFSDESIAELNLTFKEEDGCIGIAEVDDEIFFASRAGQEIIEIYNEIMQRENETKAKKEAKEAEKFEAFVEKRKAAQEKAKISHHAEFVRILSQYDADEEDNGKAERGWATVSEFIDELGNITEKTDYAY